MRKTIICTLSLLLVLASLPAAALARTVPVAASFSTAVPAGRQSVISLQGSDAEGTSLSFATTSTPSHGVLSGLNASTGYVVYTPTAGYVGADSFTYTVASGGETSTAGTVRLSVTNAKTTVTDTITDPSGNPRAGKVTFVLTQQVTTPAGLAPVGSSVSAALNSSGQFTAQVYPSRSLSPAAYYQVYFNDAMTLRQELLGVYDIPAATTPVSLAAYKVTDTNLAARYTFASQTAVESLTLSASAATLSALNSSQVTTALGYSPENPANKNQAGGYVGLNGSGQIAASQVPGLNASTQITSGTLANARTTGTSANTPSTLVARDGSGDFAAGSIAAGSITAAGNVQAAGNATIFGDATIGGSLEVSEGISANFNDAPSAPYYKVNDTKVVGEQGANIPDPAATVEGNTEALKAVLSLLRSHGLISSLFRSTLNDDLSSMWLMNNVNDAAGSNHLTNTGSVTFNSQGANFSGSNYLSVANNSTLEVPTYQSFLLATRVRLNTKATSQGIISKTDGLTANEFALTYASAADGIDRLRWTVYPGGTSAVAVNANSLGSPSVGTDYTVLAWYNSQSHQICISVNAGAADCAAATLTTHPYSSPLQIGRLGGVGINLQGSVRFVGLWSRVPDPGEGQELHDNGASLSYPLKAASTSRAAFTLQPYHFWDSRATAQAPAQPEGHFLALPFSRAVFTTAATSMDLEVYGSEPDVPDSARQINIRVNGADHSLVTPAAAAGVTTHTVSLPPGQKTVEVWTPFQALFSGVVKGTWIRKVTFNAVAQVKTASNKTPHMVIYGDSIATSAGAAETPRGGWAMLLRDAYPGSVAVEAWGGRSLAQDASNPTDRALLVQRIATQSPDILLSTIGTNDFGGAGAFGEQSAASFGTNYAAFLDDFHAASPATAVIVMSPLHRASEGGNVYGNTLTQYATQAQTVCAARTYCTFIDGFAVPGWSNGTDLYDVVHPNDSGHAKIFNYVKTFFGL